MENYEQKKSITSSRSHRLLSLALQQSQNDKQINVTKSKANINYKLLYQPRVRSPIIEADEIWLRYVDYQDFPSIFDFKNEYSLSSIEDMHEFKTKISVLFENNFSYGSKTTQIPIDYDSDDSVKDKDYVPVSDSSVSSSEDHFSGNHIVNKEIISQLDNKENGNLHDTNNMSLLTLNNPQSEPVIIEERAHSSLTKSGKPRKRKCYEEPLKDRQKKKKQEHIEKLSMKTPCNETCRQKCTTNITPERREQLHAQYINLEWEARGIFIKGCVETRQIQRRKVTNQENKKSPKRKVSLAYFFESDSRVKTEVCKRFFLTTLGYNKKNDRRVLGALKKAVDDQKDKRGSYKKKSIDRNILQNHVNSFHPSISHYRRAHAPNRLYLPSDINVNIMYTDFCAKFPLIKVSYELYRNVVKKEMNISFAHLGNEECEQCAMFKQHNKEHVTNLIEYCEKKKIEDNVIDNTEQNVGHAFEENKISGDEGFQDDSCEFCQSYLTHRKLYTETRVEYNKDEEIAKTTADTCYYSMDLQKVIMLPRMDMYKLALFCKRIVAFNESFVPVGSSNATNLPFAAIWNETVSGRSQEDILSTLRAFLIYKRDVKHVVIWADNCSSQNKNWALMSFLVSVVNSKVISADSVTIKYFEPGHTFMSADSFHHQVEKELKRKQKVYDYEDFVDAVRQSNSKKNFVKIMDLADFYMYEDCASHYKLRNMTPRVYLRNIVCIKAERGDFGLKFKKSHTGPFENLNFLKVKILKSLQFPNVKVKTEIRGISSERKNEIITKLTPLMPYNRRKFWEDLQINENAVDMHTEITE